jgi:hypothetical protein
LLQVAPIGTPPVSSSDFRATDLFPVSSSGGGFMQPQAVTRPTTSSNAAAAAAATRRNFRHNERLDASEQPIDSESSASVSAVPEPPDNSTSSICNQEEYNKIFRPVKDLSRRKSHLLIKSLGENRKKNFREKETKTFARFSLPFLTKLTNKELGVYIDRKFSSIFFYVNIGRF